MNLAYQKLNKIVSFEVSKVKYTQNNFESTKEIDFLNEIMTWVLLQRLRESNERCWMRCKKLKAMLFEIFWAIFEDLNKQLSVLLQQRFKITVARSSSSHSIVSCTLKSLSKFPSGADWSGFIEPHDESGEKWFVGENVTPYGCKAFHHYSSNYVFRKHNFVSLPFVSPYDWTNEVSNWRREGSSL